MMRKLSEPMRLATPSFTPARLCSRICKTISRQPAPPKLIGNDEIVRGYEYSKGSYVIMTEEDFEDVPVPTKHTIEVIAFVKSEEARA